MSEIKFFIKKIKVLPERRRRWSDKDNYVAFALYRDDLYLMDIGDYPYIRNLVVKEYRVDFRPFSWRGKPDGEKMYKVTANRILGKKS